ncbi:probable protein disulfide-isomerase A4 [Toxorhynchites rutilus septentrionalis]|uniref:probable protein disulfide-isomerase A4 n=1 Tax=Toxorhynchites rutilus septentrionalis TaxID=329112 RepID=UPI0024798EC0|nr:probable protein disulfide-isomerase A4 [Toxorhynchites rutilus septentrionalis]
MKLVAIIVICLVGRGLQEEDFVTEDGVLVFDPLNFETALKQFSDLMVMFYSPTCKFSKALYPKYSSAAKQLKDMGSDIKLAKFDALRYVEFAQRSGIHQYPTLVFFRSGDAIPYDGQHEQASIVRWLLRRTRNASEDDYVQELTAENFHSTISSHPFILVEFYAPWCPRCQAFEPKYVKAAQELFWKKSKIKLAKVDVTLEKQLVYQQAIQKFPTLRLYRHSDIPIDYEGEREQTPLINWLMTNTRLPVSVHTTSKSTSYSSTSPSTPSRRRIMNRPGEQQLEGADRNSSRNSLPVLLNLFVMMMVAVVLMWS